MQKNIMVNHLHLNINALKVFIHKILPMHLHLSVANEHCGNLFYLLDLFSRYNDGSLGIFNQCVYWSVINVDHGVALITYATVQAYNSRWRRIEKRW